MKIAILSDIHENFNALENALSIAKKEKVDDIFILSQGRGQLWTKT